MLMNKAETFLVTRPANRVFERCVVAARLSCRVDAKAKVCVRQSYYSVTARYAGRLEVRGSAPRR